MKKNLTILVLLLVASFALYAQDGGRKFPLVVQFASFCCGVPSDTSIVNYVRRFKKNNKIKTISAYKVGPMGREGEYYLAFPLVELNKKQEKKFVAEIANVKVAEGDRGAIHYEKDFIIDNTGTSTTIMRKKDLIKF